MAIDDRRIWSEIHRDQPSKLTDATWGAVRGSRYGEVGITPFGKGKYAFADEGTYFIATNPTPGTGVAGIAAADGNDDTENLICLYNGTAESAGTRVYLDYLRLYPTAAGTNGTNTSWVHKIDNANRWTSGGSAITPVNPNADDSGTSGCTLHVGAVVSPAATSQRLLGGGVLRVVIKVIGDIYYFDFGGNGAGAPGGTIINGTAPAAMYIPCCPVILGSGDSWMFQINAASQSVAAAFEFELAWWER